MLVLRPGALGDTLLAVPALRALRARCSPVVLAGHSGASRLLAAVGEVDKGLDFDDPMLAWVVGGGAPGAYEGEPIVAWMGASVALAAPNVVVRAASRPATEQHCAAYLLETLRPLGVDVTVPDTRPLRITEVSSDEVLVHPGSGSLAKNWPPERFAQVIRRLEAPVRLVVGEADLEPARALEAALGRELPRLEHVPLAELARRLAGCRAYLGNDSGVSHLAGLCGARTVALFGPTSPTMWRPLGPQVKVVPFQSTYEDVLTALGRD